VISGILLAAGAARRFGGGKLSQSLPDGIPVGIAALRNLQSALQHVLVVLRPGDDVLAALYASAEARIIVCDDAALGMGHSLAAAIAHESEATGWVVALADMPYVMPSTIRAVADLVSEGKGIVLPCLGAERGHPVGFHRVFRDELVALKGDSGARSVIQAHPNAVRRLPVNDPGILQDIDTLEDLRRLSRS
jgi:molybdenum cofactor cytidylyltransferase